MSGERMVIIGSGPSAAATALALSRLGHRQIEVFDIGSRLEPETQSLVTAMSAQSAPSWTASEVGAISRQPVAMSKTELPQKRVYGSDFPFRDAGQLDGMNFVAGANSAPVSSAYGGFSNVWGAQLMPFSRATFDTWPISWDQIEPHYRAVLDEVPLAGEPDDLLEHFPLLTEQAQPLPPLAGRSRQVLANYSRHHDRLRAAGIRVGRARLALQAKDCISCGLCMTGCPYGLIYSASQTFDQLRRDGIVSYQANRLAVRVGEDDRGAFVRLRNLTDGTHETVRADRLFVACGGIGSTRLILGSLPDRPQSIALGESVQFALPFLSRRSAGDPRAESTFTLNQFNLLVEFDDSAFHTSQVHCYPYNPSVLAALPVALQLPSLSGLTGAILGRLTIGLGYLPSWASPPVRITVDHRGSEELPHLTIGDEQLPSRPLMLTEVLRRLRRAGRALDLFPVEPAMRLSATAKSYHFGGSLAHRAPGPTEGVGTDSLGRPGGWQRIHVVDGSVLPSVPSTTFTFTVMANAHRIATEAVSGP
jgi:choline dehydrogenase-like flavoprotein